MSSFSLRMQASINNFFKDMGVYVNILKKFSKDQETNFK